MMNNRNLFATLAVVALLTVVATTAGCTTNTTPSPTLIPATTTTAGNNTTFSSAAGFNITYPTILKIDKDENASVPVRVYIYQNPSNIIDGVNVATLGLTAGATLSDFANNEVLQLKNYSIYDVYKNFTIVNQTSSTLSGKNASTIVWTGVIPVQNNATSFTNTSVKVMQTYVVNNNTGYVITYKAIPSDFDKYLPQAQKIMNSFVLT
jgi:hypothetical protein